MDQVEDYLDKIEHCIKNSQKPIPYSLQSFYTIFKQAALKIEQKDTSIEMIGNMSKIFKFLKQYLESATQSPKDRQKIFPQLKRLVAPFRKFLPVDEISKAFVVNFEDINTFRKVTQKVEKATSIKEQYLKRNNPIHQIGNSDFASSFWILNFKADCAVHFSVYWNAFIELTKQFLYLQRFISDSSKKTIKSIIDPDDKFYIGMAANNQLFLQLFQPNLLRQLADETAKNEKPPLFQSTHQLRLKFKMVQPIQTALKDQDIIILSGEQVLIGSQAKKCKYAPTIRFGSSNDSQIQLKHKFISRRQFMIIEEQLDYSIVCLSHSNYTSVRYPRKLQITPGMLFKIGSQIIQVLRITQNVSFFNQSFSITQYENTLTHLPQQDTIKPDKILEYKILSGSKKDQKGTINQKFSTIALDEEEMDIIVSTSDDKFYLPAYTQVLLKNATQVLKGQLSDKVCIEQGMTINLEQFTLTVL